jgi:hypothetical protein
MPASTSLRLPESFSLRGHDHHLVRGLDLGRHVGEPEQDRLVLDELLAERLALLGVGDAELERPAGHAAGPRGDVDAADLDAVHHLVEALAGHATEDLGSRSSCGSPGPARSCRRPCSPSSRSCRGP